MIARRPTSAQARPARRNSALGSAYRSSWAEVAEPAEPVPSWVPLVRLRYVLGLSLVGALFGWTLPRARAGWEAHALGTALADYAACMAGPGGPKAIRDDLTEFHRLVRRRLLAAGPDERPFERCAKNAARVTGSPKTLAEHRAPARVFAEYGAGTDEPGELSIDALGVDGQPLRAAARDAWPFLRGGYTRLVRTSLDAQEAPHPVAPIRPDLGVGLPEERTLFTRACRAGPAIRLSLGDGAHRFELSSSDAGLTFRSARALDPDDKPCASEREPAEFELSSEADGSLSVTTREAEREPFTTTAVQGEHLLVALDRDERALVLAARRERSEHASLVLCPFRSPCLQLRGPQGLPFDPLLASEMDVARVSGATVISVAREGIVRVASSRDDGRSWTPAGVVFDAKEHPHLGANVPVPNRLLSLETRLLLYGAPRRRSDRYPVLVSTDQGASFRSFGTAPAADLPERTERENLARAPRGAAD